MPVIQISFSADELIGGALEVTRKLSAEVLKLSDLEASPLQPGETADTRRHQIAKLGKKLAAAFIALDQVMTSLAEQHQRDHGDVAATPATKPDNPDAN